MQKASEHPFDERSKTFYTQYFRNKNIRSDQQFEVFSRGRSIDVVTECTEVDFAALEDTCFSHFQRVNSLELKGPHDPYMTGVQYAKNVEEYLHSHLDDPVIQRLRTNEPFTPTDREALEKTLIAIGEEEGAILLANLLKQRGALSLAHYVLSCVGMDRAAARAACAHFLNEPSLTELQISFIEMVIEQLSARGFLDASALYESPFSDLHGRGPEELFLGQEKVIDGLFETLALLAPKVQSIGE